MVSTKGKTLFWHLTDQLSLCQCPPQQTVLSTETLWISKNSCMKHLMYIGLFQFFGPSTLADIKELTGKLHSHENLSHDTSLSALYRTKIFYHSFVILNSWVKNTFAIKWISSVKFLNDRSFFLCINSSHSTRLKYSGLFVSSGPGSSACLCISYWYKGYTLRLCLVVLALFKDLKIAP